MMHLVLAAVLSISAIDASVSGKYWRQTTFAEEEYPVSIVKTRLNIGFKKEASAKTALDQAGSRFSDEDFDRQWLFQEDAIDTKGLGAPHWTNWLNKQEEKLQYNNTDKIIVGFQAKIVVRQKSSFLEFGSFKGRKGRSSEEGEGDGSIKDDIWRVKTRAINNNYAVSRCYWTPSNAFGQDLNARCKESYYFFGFRSEYNQKLKDRKYEFMCCRLSTCHDSCTQCKGEGPNECTSCAEEYRLLKPKPKKGKPVGSTGQCRCPAYLYGLPPTVCSRCPAGLRPSDDQTECVDLDECGENVHSCPGTSRCINTKSSWTSPLTYQCGCKKGFEIPKTYEYSEPEKEQNTTCTSDDATFEGNVTDVATCIHKCNGQSNCRYATIGPMKFVNNGNYSQSIVGHRLCRNCMNKPTKKEASTITVLKGQLEPPSAERLNHQKTASALNKVQPYKPIKYVRNKWDAEDPQTEFQIQQVDQACHLSGKVKYGNDSLIAEIPESCRPDKRLTFSVVNQLNEASRIDILPDGQVKLVTGMPESKCTIQQGVSTVPPSNLTAATGVLKIVPNVFSVGDCCSLCNREDECLAWTYFAEGGGSTPTTRFECVLKFTELGEGRIDAEIYPQVTYSGKKGKSYGWVSLDGVAWVPASALVKQTPLALKSWEGDDYGQPTVAAVNGRCFVSGNVRPSGTQSQIIGTLPTECHPAELQYFVGGQHAHGQVLVVQTSGEIKLLDTSFFVGLNRWLSLSNIVVAPKSTPLVGMKLAKGWIGKPAVAIKGGLCSLQGLLTTTWKQSFAEESTGWGWGKKKKGEKGRSSSSMSKGSNLWGKLAGPLPKRCHPTVAKTFLVVSGQGVAEVVVTTDGNINFVKGLKNPIMPQVSLGGISFAAPVKSLCPVDTFEVVGRSAQGPLTGDVVGNELNWESWVKISKTSTGNTKTQKAKKSKRRRGRVLLEFQGAKKGRSSKGRAPAKSPVAVGPVIGSATSDKLSVQECGQRCQLHPECRSFAFSDVSPKAKASCRLFRTSKVNSYKLDQKTVRQQFVCKLENKIPSILEQGVYNAGKGYAPITVTSRRGVCYLQGVVSIKKGSSVIAKLPSNCKPKAKETTFWLSQKGGNAVQVRVLQNGQLLAKTQSETIKYVGLGSISFPAQTVIAESQDLSTAAKDNNTSSSSSSSSSKTVSKTASKGTANKGRPGKGSTNAATTTAPKRTGGNGRSAKARHSKKSKPKRSKPKRTAKNGRKPKGSSRHSKKSKPKRSRPKRTAKNGKKVKPKRSKRKRSKSRRVKGRGFLFLEHGATATKGRSATATKGRSATAAKRQSASKGRKNQSESKNKGKDPSADTFSYDTSVMSAKGFRVLQKSRCVLSGTVSLKSKTVFTGLPSEVTSKTPGVIWTQLSNEAFGCGKVRNDIRTVYTSSGVMVMLYVSEKHGAVLGIPSSAKSKGRTGFLEEITAASKGRKSAKTSKEVGKTGSKESGTSIVLDGLELLLTTVSPNTLPLGLGWDSSLDGLAASVANINGICEMSGVVYGGDSSSWFAQLPAECRPQSESLYQVSNLGSPLTVSVDTEGYVRRVSGSTGSQFLVLSTIRIVLPKDPCPANYAIVHTFGAAVKGCGLDCSSMYRHTTAKACAKACRANEKCKAFTFTPKGVDPHHKDMTVCGLYDTTVPNEMKLNPRTAQQMFMCRKAPSVLLGGWKPYGNGFQPPMAADDGDICYLEGVAVFSSDEEQDLAKANAKEAKRSRVEAKQMKGRQKKSTSLAPEPKQGRFSEVDSEVDLFFREAMSKGRKGLPTKTTKKLSQKVVIQRMEPLPMIQIPNKKCWPRKELTFATNGDSAMGVPALVSISTKGLVSLISKGVGQPYKIGLNDVLWRKAGSKPAKGRSSKGRSFLQLSKGRKGRSATPSAAEFSGYKIKLASGWTGQPDFSVADGLCFLSGSISSGSSSSMGASSPKRKGRSFLGFAASKGRSSSSSSAAAAAGKAIANLPKQCWPTAKLYFNAGSSGVSMVSVDPSGVLALVSGDSNLVLTGILFAVTYEMKANYYVQGPYQRPLPLTNEWADTRIEEPSAAGAAAASTKGRRRLLALEEVAARKGRAAPAAPAAPDTDASKSADAAQKESDLNSAKSKTLAMTLLGSQGLAPASSYYNKERNLCVLQGVVFGGDLDAGDILEVPIVCRPGSVLTFATVNVDAVQTLQLSTKGMLSWVKGPKRDRFAPNQWLSLSGIAFVPPASPLKTVPKLKMPEHRSLSSGNETVNQKYNVNQDHGLMCKFVPLVLTKDMLKTTNSKIYIDMSTDTLTSKYRLTISEYSAARTEAKPMKGFPRTINNTFALFNLAAGTYYKVTVEPWLNDEFSTVHAVPTDALTKCGCHYHNLTDTAEQTGMPSNVVLKQHMGVIRFSWKDESLCEESFSFGRATNYEVRIGERTSSKSSSVTKSAKVTAKPTSTTGKPTANATGKPTANATGKPTANATGKPTAKKAAGKPTTRVVGVKKNATGKPTANKITTASPTAAKLSAEKRTSKNGTTAEGRSRKSSKGKYPKKSKTKRSKPKRTAKNGKKPKSKRTAKKGSDKKRELVKEVAKDGVHWEYYYVDENGNEISALVKDKDDDGEWVYYWVDKNGDEIRPASADEIKKENIQVDKIKPEPKGQPPPKYHKKGRKHSHRRLLSVEKSANFTFPPTQQMNATAETGSKAAKPTVAGKPTPQPTNYPTAKPTAGKPTPALPKYTSFTTDYSYASGSKCGGEHAPEFVKDKLKSVLAAIPGSTQQYCITALRGGDLNAYKSKPSCKTIKIKWEAELVGKVKLDKMAGHLPVPGVKVFWKIGNVTGNVTTDGNGDYRIHIFTDKLTALEQKITLSPFKQSGKVVHRWLCDKTFKCSNKTLSISHLDFGRKYNFIDDTSVPLKGGVYIKGTETDAAREGCPLPLMEVCLLNHFNMKERLLCKKTDSKGQFAVPAVLGMTVRLEVSYPNSNHSFARIGYTTNNAPSGVVDEPNAEYYEIREGKEWEFINFHDTSEDTLQVDVVGGKCNRILGAAEVEVTYGTCQHWKRTLKLGHLASGSWTMPAHKLNVHFKKITTKAGQFYGAAYDYFKGLDRLVAKVDLDEARRLRKDKDQPSKTEKEEEKKMEEKGIPGVQANPVSKPNLARFEFHPRPTLTVKFVEKLPPKASFRPTTQPTRKPTKLITHSPTISAKQKWENRLTGLVKSVAKTVKDKAVAEVKKQVTEKVMNYTKTKLANMTAKKDEKKKEEKQKEEKKRRRLLADDDEDESNDDFADDEHDNFANDELEHAKLEQMELDLDRVEQVEEDGEACIPMTGKAGSVTIVMVTVTEDFGAGIDKCDWVDGTVRIYNHLGETHEEVDTLIQEGKTAYSREELEMLRACEKKACNETILMDRHPNAIPKNAKVTKQLLLGSPNINAGTVYPKNSDKKEGSPAPYAKALRVVMHVKPHVPVEHVTMMTVTGSKIIGKGFSVVIPEYFPLLVLHDPPGGSSYAEYKNTKVHINMEVDWIKFKKDVDIGLGVQVLGEPSLGSCAGLGYMACLKQFVGKMNLGYYKQFDDDGQGEYETEKGGNFELTFSYRTSDKPENAGLMSDMYLVPGLNIKFAETQTIGYDMKTCTGTSKKSYQWGLEKGDGNKDVFTWMSHSEILHEEIPKLQRMLEAEKDPDKVQKLQAGVNGWTATLAKNEAKYKAAKQGQLQKPTALKVDQYSGLAPEDLVNKAEKLDKSGEPPPLNEESTKTKLLKGVGKILNNKYVAMAAPHIEKNIAAKEKKDAEAKKKKDEEAKKEKEAAEKKPAGRRLLAQSSLGKGLTLANAKAIYAREFTNKQKQKVAKPNALMKAAVSSLKFSGGDSLMTYAVAQKEHYKKTTFSQGLTTIDLETEGTNMFKVLGIGVKLKHRLKYFYEEKKKRRPYQETDTEVHTSFTLGDPDIGDSFVVDVFIDPDYKTYMFVATEGLSRCPHEAGTEAAERLALKKFQIPVAASLPNEGRLFKLALENNGEKSNFELFTDVATNPDGLVVSVDGSPLTAPIKFSSMTKGTTYVTVAVHRGPEKFSYKPLTVGFRSQCQPSLKQTVELPVEFLQPCSKIGFASDLENDHSFTLNLGNNKKETNPGVMEIVSRNPNFASRTWKQDARFQKAIAEYKPAGDIAESAWRVCEDKDGNALEFQKKVSPFGFSSLYWNTAKVPDGKYALRLRSICSATGHDKINGMKQQVSETIFGVIDTTPPRQFGVAEPSNGKYFPGSKMSVSFDEPIRCDQPYRFDLDLKIDGIARDFKKGNMLVICKENTLSFGFTTAVDYETIINRKATLTVANVSDLAGNKLVDTAISTFKFQALKVEDASMIVKNIVLRKAPGTGGTSHSKALHQEIASLLELRDSSRLDITGVAELPGGSLSVDLLLKPASISERGRAPTASKLIERLYDQIDAHSSGATSLLEAGLFSYLQEAVVDEPQSFLASIVPSDEDRANYDSLIQVDLKASPATSNLETKLSQVLLLNEVILSTVVVGVLVAVVVILLRRLPTKKQEPAAHAEPPAAE